MEERGQYEAIGKPKFGYDQQNGREPSSSKFTTSSLVSSVGVGRDQNTAIVPNLDRQHVYPPPHALNLQAQRPRRDPDHNPDPCSAVATNSGATSTQIASGSQLRPPTAAVAAPTIRYRECLKNHAASMGTHVLDGCGEFMSSGKEGTPEALKCAACDCHRNFHRKEIDGESQNVTNPYYTHNPLRNANTSRRNTAAAASRVPAAIQTQTSLQQHQRHSQGLWASPSTGPVPTVMMAFGSNGGAPAESTSEDLNMYQSNSGHLAKKRVRTKFTQEQKDKMMEFCEKLGWKIQKQDEEQVQLFCSEIGVRRQVFRVWMHNNKQVMKRATVRPNI